jgi:hypothetical protein
MLIPERLTRAIVTVAALFLLATGGFLGLISIHTPTANAASARVCAGSVGKNPYCYTLNAKNGKLIRQPASGLCRYVSCVSTFWKDTRGYVVECKDDRYSHSGGIKGACSRNKGVKQPLYAH